MPHMNNNDTALFAVPAILLLLLLLLSFSSPSLTIAQQIGGATTTPTTPSPTLPPTTGQTTAAAPLSPPLTAEEQEQQTRLQNVIAATNQNLDEAEKEVGGVVYTPRWSNPVWVEADSLAVLVAYCLPGEFAESGQEILGGFELEVLESYEIALAQGFMAWTMVIGNEDRQDRLPAAVGVVCVSDLNDAQTRVLSPEEQQQINNVVQQFITTQVTDIDQVINIINNVTTTPTMPPGNNNTNSTTGGDTTPPVFTIIGGGYSYTTSDPQGFRAAHSVTVEDNVDGFAQIVNLPGKFNILEQDDVGGDITISCTPPSGSLFPVGVTTVQCTAVDQAGNVATRSFTVTVRLIGTPPGPTDPGPIVPGVIPNATITSEADTIPPIVQGPNSIRLPAKGLEGTPVTYGVIAEDNVNGRARLDDDNNLSQDSIAGDITLSCNPPSGSLFPVGTITVQCTAVDEAGNTGTYSFTITVELRTPFGALQGEEQQPPTPPAEEEEQQPPVVADEGAAAPPVEEEEEAATTTPPANEGG
jgi:hypothetical protein